MSLGGPLTPITCRYLLLFATPLLTLICCTEAGNRSEEEEEDVAAYRGQSRVDLRIRPWMEEAEREGPMGREAGRRMQMVLKAQHEMAPTLAAEGFGEIGRALG